MLMLEILIVVAVIVFIFGCCIGSFLNVCIYRIPKQEDITFTRSHCMECGNVLKWYELIPVASFVAQKGRCRNCKTKLSVQYPVIELLNGIFYCVIFCIYGLTMLALLLCILSSVLIVITVIDWRYYEIPLGCNICILILGIIRVITDYHNALLYVIGFFAVSLFLLILFLASNGRAIGGGDIKLMAAAGLFLGWKNVLLAFAIGCIGGAIIHLIRMRVSDKDHVLAFGPYLSAGILIAALFGDELVSCYLALVGL